MKARSNEVICIETDIPAASLLNEPEGQITLSDDVYNRWMERGQGKLLCAHEWQNRQALDLGELIIRCAGTIKECNFPAGRYCKKCGKVDFTHSEGAEAKWSKADFLH